MLKRMVSLILLFCFLFGYENTIFASENENGIFNMTEDEMNEILMSRGATEYFLAKIPMSEKYKLIECEAGGFETKSETYIIQEPSSDSAQSRGATLSEKELTLDITISHYWFGTPDARIFFYITYEWKDMPTWRLTDYLSVNWEDDFLMPIDNSAALIDRLISNGKEVSTDTHYEMNASNRDSIIWAIDIRTENGCEMKSGYATVSFKPRPGVDHNLIATKFYVNYAHVTIIPTVGITLGEGGRGVSISAAKNVYERGIYKEFNTITN